MNTNQKGDTAEAKLIFESIKLGYVVSKPFGDCPYDVVIDKSGKMYRVQVKYVTPTNGRLCISFEARSRTKGNGCYNKDTVDALVLYNAVTEMLYWVDVKEFDGKTSVALRIESTRNNQKKGIKMAEDYAFV